MKEPKEDPGELAHVRYHFKSKKVCDDVVCEDSCSLQFAPDWFAAQKQVKIWYDDKDYCFDDNDGGDHELIAWGNGYKIRISQKSDIKKKVFTCRMAPFLILGLVFPRGSGKRDSKIMER